MCSLLIMSHWLESDTLNALLQGNVLAIAFSMLRVLWDFTQREVVFSASSFFAEPGNTSVKEATPYTRCTCHCSFWPRTFQVPFVMMLFGWMGLVVACYFLETAIIGYFRERSKSLTNDFEELMIYENHIVLIEYSLLKRGIQPFPSNRLGSFGSFGSFWVVSTRVVRKSEVK